MKKQQGFTLIELIVVIVILGILSAIALPKFSALQVDARVAQLSAARGAVQAASAIVHATALARAGVSDAATCPGGGGTANNLVGVAGTVCTEAGVVSITYSYPASVTGGIINAAGLSSVNNPNLATLNIEGYAAVPVAPLTTFSVVGGASTAAVTGGRANNSCSFTYTAPTTAGAAPVISALVTTDC